jgi:hypothetical protein
MSVFVDDAVFDMRAATLGVYEGAEAIREYFATSQLPNMAHQIHLATNHRLALDGDKASGTVYHLVHGTAHSGATIFAGGYHDDIYLRTDEGWRLHTRKAVSLLKADMRAVGGQPKESQPAAPS